MILTPGCLARSFSSAPLSIALCTHENVLNRLRQPLRGPYPSLGSTYMLRYTGKHPDGITPGTIKSFAPSAINCCSTHKELEQSYTQHAGIQQRRKCSPRHHLRCPERHGASSCRPPWDPSRQRVARCSHFRLIHQRRTGTWQRNPCILQEIGTEDRTQFR